MSLDDLERRLWDAANALRGPVDPADFKTYVFPMLFWKWISDNYDWERARAVADYGDDVDPEVEADFHKFELLSSRQVAPPASPNIRVTVGADSKTGSAPTHEVVLVSTTLPSPTRGTRRT